MLSTILIVGDNQQKIEEEIQKLAGEIINTPDYLLYDDPGSIKINEIREIQKKIALKPYSHTHKIIVIKNAENLTLPAQNALLKTLEEPPQSAIIILTVNKKESLLPTVLSRCRIIKIIDNGEWKIDNEDEEITEKIRKSGAGERLVIADQFGKDKETAKNFCQKQLLIWRRLGKRQITDKIFLSIKQLDGNINPSLIIGNLLLSYPGWDKI